MEKVTKRRSKIKRDYYELEQKSRNNENVRDITRPESARDLMKFEFCNHVIGFMRRHKIKQKELAEILKNGGTKADEGKISLIINLKYGEFKLDRLISYVEVLAKKDDVSKLFLKSRLERTTMPVDDLMYDSEYVEKKIILVEDNEDIEGEFIEAPQEIFDLLAS